MSGISFDPCFPQIEKVLDKELMRKVFQESFFPAAKHNETNTIVVDSCEIEYMRHKLAFSFVLSYRLMLLNTETGFQEEQVLTARLCKYSQNPCDQEQANRNLYTGAGRVSTVLYLPQLEMLVWIFPNDRKLISLAAILNIDFLKVHVGKMLPALGFGSDCHISDVNTEILHYLPERSCMIRYNLVINDPIQDAKIERIIYGKNYRDDSGGKIYSVMCQLKEQLKKIATPLNYDVEYRTLWQSHVEGCPLEWHDLETTHSSWILKNVADCIAAFQSCQLEPLSYYGFIEIDDQLTATVKTAESQGQVFLEQITLWKNNLIAKRHNLFSTETHPSPLHQDLHLGNILLNQNGVCLIDLDTVCLGNPLADVGSLIASFYRYGLHAGRCVSDVDRVVNLFLHHYELAVSYKISRPQLDWFIAAALVHEVIRRIIQKRHETGLKYIQTYLELSKQYAGSVVEELESA